MAPGRLASLICTSEVLDGIDGRKLVQMSVFQPYGKFIRDEKLSRREDGGDEDKGDGKMLEMKKGHGRKENAVQQAGLFD